MAEKPKLDTARVLEFFDSIISLAADAKLAVEGGDTKTATDLLDSIRGDVEHLENMMENFNGA